MLSLFIGLVFLNKTTFDKCSTLYNFCRTLDDLVDSDKNLEIKKENFKKFKRRFCK